MNFQEEGWHPKEGQDISQCRPQEAYEERLWRDKAELLRHFLAVMDNLERALAYRDGEPGLREGLGLVHRQMAKLLAEEGVEEFRSLGQAFDPNYHEAVEALPGDGEPVVMAEWEKGYLYRGKLLRPARVSVAGG